MRFIVKTSEGAVAAEIYWAACNELEHMKGQCRGWAKQHVGYSAPRMGEFMIGVRNGWGIERAEVHVILDHVCGIAGVEWYDLDEHEQAIVRGIRAEEAAHA